MDDITPDKTKVSQNQLDMVWMRMVLKSEIAKARTLSKFFDMKVLSTKYQTKIVYYTNHKIPWF